MLRLLALLLLPFPALAAECSPRLPLSQIFTGPGPLCLTSGSTIAVEGDSLTYGMDMKGPLGPINKASQNRVATPFPEDLARRLGPTIKVTNRGYPGDRTPDGATRWQSAPSTSLVILMYGTNDAMNYGSHKEGTLTPEAYSESLTKLIRRHQQQGSKVLVLAPPLLGNPEHEKTLAPYRPFAARSAALTKAWYLDTPKVLPTNDIWLDDVHLTAAPYRTLAAYLSGYVGIAPKFTPKPKQK